MNFIINVFRILVKVVLGTFFLSQVSEMFFGVKNGRLKYCTVIFTSCGVHVFDAEFSDMMFFEFFDRHFICIGIVLTWLFAGYVWSYRVYN